MELVIKLSDEVYKSIIKGKNYISYQGYVEEAIKNGTPLTPDILADMLMEERIRGKLDSDITFEKDIIHDVKCRLNVSIRDHRPCYCGAELREVWRESEAKE